MHGVMLLLLLLQVTRSWLRNAVWQTESQLAIIDGQQYQIQSVYACLLRL
jgi:hypothetical protein